jgi:hypothetical protein
VRQIILSPRPDPFANDVVLYVKGSGADGGTTFTDSSRYKHSVTRQGSNIVTSTLQSKLGGSAVYGATSVVDSCLVVPQNSVFDIGAKNYTIEYWYYRTGTVYAGGTPTLANIFTLDGLDFPLAIYEQSALPMFYAWGSNSAWTNSTFTNSASANSLNNWQHHAWCRKDGFMRSFVNGQLFSTVADSSTIGTPVGNLSLFGSRNSGGTYGNIRGFMNNFRFTMAGRYDRDFNPDRDTFMR